MSLKIEYETKERVQVSQQELKRGDIYVNDYGVFMRVHVPYKDLSSKVAILDFITGSISIHNANLNDPCGYRVDARLVVKPSHLSSMVE